MTATLTTELLELEGATFEVEELVDSTTVELSWSSSSCSCSSCCSCSTSSCCSTSTSTS